MKLNPNSCAFFPDRNSIGRKSTLNPNADPYECNPFSREKKSPFKHVRSNINLGARSFVHMKTCRSPKEDFFVQSGGYINNTRNYTSLPTSLSMINEPFICNFFHGLSSNNIHFPSSDAFRKPSDISVSIEDTGIAPPAIFYLNPTAECFVPTFDDPAKGFTTGKIGSSINSIARFDVPTETSKDHLAAKDTDTNDDPYSIINNLKIKNPNRVIIAHININSLRNKFDILSDIVKNKIDIICISETKLDDTFPSSIFFYSRLFCTLQIGSVW